MRFIRTRGSDLKGIEELEVYVLFFPSTFGLQPIYLFKECLNEDRQFVAEPRMVCTL
jgi:hypothetical protein